MARTLLDLGPREAVLKLGARGAVAVTRGGEVVQDIVPVTLVDPIGAGDAFVAGYLAGLLDGTDLPGRLLLAATCGAFAVASPGDWEGLPRRAELDLLHGADVTR